MEAVSNDIHRFVERAIPFLSILEEISWRANKITSEVEGYWNEIDHLTKIVRVKFSNLIAMKKLISTRKFTIGFIKNSKSLVKNIFSKFSTY